ncbi:MAG: DUF2723 domain-containing protein [Deltaproteobacteria bacterium]|nr:DUF2723 domain-containing protein [Deltaproteobacteria bacterium]MBW2419548.1 DUF2723 domain-containing protein [Deltaproteobacteria bacterium]
MKAAAGRPSPAQDVQPLSRLWPHLLAVFAGALALYAFTAPRTIALEDDGLFVMAAEFLGIAHPPGYPLFVLIAKLFTLLPVGSVAFRVHLASGVFGAGACSVLWWIVRRLVPRPGVAYVAAAAFAVSELMWSQAIIAEVYTLNLLLFLLLFALSLVYLESPRRGVLAALGLVYGMSLSNHYPLILLATPCLALILWPRRRQILRDGWLALPGLLLGLTPYLWMVWRSRHEPAMSFYGPIRDLREFASYVARRGYAGLESSANASWWDKAQLAGFLLRECLRQLTPVGALLAGLGFAFQCRETRSSWGLALLVGFVSGGFLLLAFLSPEYEHTRRLIWRVYPMIPYALMAICLGLGLHGVMRRLEERGSNAAGHFVGVLGGLIVAALLLQNWPLNDRRGYDFARDYGTTVLESFAPGAIVFTDTDADTAPIGYLNLVDGVRPDVTLYHAGGLVLPSRLFHARAAPAAKEQALREFLAEAGGRSVYFMGSCPPEWGCENLGLYERLDRSRQPGRPRFTLRPDLLALARRMAGESADADPWSRGFADTELANFAVLLGQKIAEDPRGPLAASYLEDLDLMRAGFYGALGWVKSAHAYGSAEPEEILAWTEHAEGLVDPRVAKRDHAALLTVKGTLLLRLGRDDESEESYRASIALDPNPDGAAVFGLLRILAGAGRTDEYRALRERFFSNRLPPLELRRLDREAGL